MKVSDVFGVFFFALLYTLLIAVCLYAFVITGHLQL